MSNQHEEFARASNQEMRIRSLEEEVEGLKGARPGRKKKPILVSHDNICGVEPDSDSAYCSYASVYRRQQGCMGEACKRASSEYYRDYRNVKR